MHIMWESPQSAVGFPTSHTTALDVQAQQHKQCEPSVSGLDKGYIMAEKDCKD